MAFAATWLDVEFITLNEVRQMEKERFCLYAESK